MDIRYRTYLIAFFAMAVFAGGCAKREMVKKDETIPAPPKSAATASVKPQAGGAGIADTGIRKEQVPASTATSSPTSSHADSVLAASLEKIYFDFDSFTLSKSSRDVLAKNAKSLKNSMVKIRIEGNCDERGSDEYNLALGERRAKEAKKYMTMMGISADRLSTVSYGKEKPADPAHTQEAWGKNRRDEFVLLK